MGSDDGTGPTWTRESVADLVRGAIVAVLDDAARTLSVPGWLAVAADGVDERPTEASFALIHADDRAAVAQVYMDCLRRPGELIERSARMCHEDVWGHFRMRWVNLLGAPGVDLVLMLADAAEGPPIVVPEPAEAGEGSATYWMICHLDGTRILRATGCVHEVLGYTAAELVGMDTTQLIHPDSLVDGVKAFRQLRDDPTGSMTSRRRWFRKDGSEVWIEASNLGAAYAEGATSVAFMWDITERRAQEAALRDSRERFRLLADEVPVGVFMCDPDGRIVFHNTRWAELVGPGGKDQEVAELAEVVAADVRAAVRDAVAAALADPAGDRRRMEVTATDGRRVFSLTLRAGGETDQTQRTVIGSLEDITATIRLRDEARRDPLTGLPNRAALDVHLAPMLDEDTMGTLVVFLDLDGFKAVNDTYGHEAGDDVLKAVAARLTAAVRPGDHVCRQGGDEFVIVCRGLDDEAASLLPFRIEAALGEPVRFDGGAWRPAASIGLARPVAGDDIAAVLRRADRAMFEVKRTRER